VFTKHPVQLKTVKTFSKYVLFKKAHKQKGGCLDTLDTPWIRHWLYMYYYQAASHAWSAKARPVVIDVPWYELDMTMNCAKTAELIEMPIVTWTRVVARNRV